MRNAMSNLSGNLNLSMNAAHVQSLSSNEHGKPGLTGRDLCHGPIWDASLPLPKRLPNPRNMLVTPGAVRIYHMIFPSKN